VEFYRRIGWGDYPSGVEALASIQEPIEQELTCILGLFTI
jgi:hypothetical protein